MLIDRHRAAFLSIDACGQLDADAKDKLFAMYRREVKHGFNTEAKENASARVGGDTILVNFSNFAGLPDNERSQTLVHEMAHLAGYEHDDKKSTDVPGDGGSYYSSVPLQAELCIAGVQSDEVCEIGADGISQVLKPYAPGITPTREGTTSVEGARTSIEGAQRRLDGI